jgi:HlyD family secretion protein
MARGMGANTRTSVQLFERSIPPDTPSDALADRPGVGHRPPRARPWLVRAAVLGLVIGVVITARLTVLRPSPVPVTVFRVATGLVEETVTNSKAGTVGSRRRADLSPEIAGRVIATPVDAGNRVRRGAVLLRLADDEAQAQLHQQERLLDAARSDERRACAAAGQAARELTRARALTAEGVAPASTLDRAETELATTDAGCDAARAQVRQRVEAVRAATVALRRTTLRAPFDGVVAEVRTEVGEWITPSPPGILLPPTIELIDPAAVYISAALDEVDVAKVRLEQPVRVTLDALPGQTFGGRVTRIAPYVLDRVEQGRTFEVEVTLAEAAASASLVPGSSADVEIVLRAKDGVLRVPSYALIQERAVLVVREQRLVERPVTIGLRNWDMVEITSGLAAGDAVVVSLDRPEVKPGTLVHVEAEVRR